MKLLVWDFDGTLGYRDNRWSGAFTNILQEEAPDFIFTRSNLSVALQTGFPWHTPDVSHPHIKDADTWWAMMEPCFENAFIALGLDSVRSTRFAKNVRQQYCSPNQWHLYPDSLESLEQLSLFGWEHIVLSNHVPELPQIFDHLGIRKKFVRIVNSADTGYEKPHPQSYVKAIEGLSGIDELWMIGDSLHADFEGAKTAGWKAILVRQTVSVTPAFQTLSEVVNFLTKSSKTK